MTQIYAIINVLMLYVRINSFAKFPPNKNTAVEMIDLGSET